MNKGPGSRNVADQRQLYTGQVVLEPIYQTTYYNYQTSSGMHSAVYLVGLGNLLSAPIAGFPCFIT